jgi:antirestriction protein ArdC
MSTIDHTATDKRNVYARVTAQIINAIEQGVGTWRMPWHTSGRYAFSPINATSKKPYRGINTVCLWAAAQAKGYERGEWATYQPWQDKGTQVRKGEKATLVVLWKFANDSGESEDDGAEPSAGCSRLLFTRGYSVFNAAQVDGYTPKVDTDATMPERIANAEAFFTAIGANVCHGYYSRSLRAHETTWSTSSGCTAFQSSCGTPRSSRTHQLLNASPERYSRHVPCSSKIWISLGPTRSTLPAVIRP